MFVQGEHLEGRRWLAQDAEAVEKLGAGPLQVLATDVGADGDRVGVFVALPAEECFVTYARGAQGVEDVDLYAYADDGSTLGTDEAADPHPAIMICPPNGGRAYIVARIAAGRGIVTIGGHAVPRANVMEVGRVLGAHGHPGEEVGRIEAWPGLAEKVVAHRRMLGGHWQEIRRVATQLDAGAPTRISVTMEPGRCLDVLVVASDEVAQLEVLLLDAHDRIVARAAAVGRDRAVVVCSPVQTPISLEIRPHAGQGLCAVSIASSSGDIEQSVANVWRIERLAPTSDVASARAARGANLRSLGYAEPRFSRSGAAEVGRRTTLAIPLPEGCSRVDIIAGTPLAGITAALWDSDGRLLAEGELGTGPTLFACGKSGTARLDAEATMRPGPFAVEVRGEPKAPAALLQNPLAAGRLLGVLNDGRGVLTAAGTAPVQVAHVEASRLSTFEVVVPEGRCMDVAVALGAHAAGVEERLVDRASGEELALAHGRTSALARACASASTRALRVEVRLTTGETQALLSSRLAPFAPGLLPSATR